MNGALGHIGNRSRSRYSGGRTAGRFAGRADPANQSPSNPPSGQLVRIRISEQRGWFSVGWDRAAVAIAQGDDRTHDARPAVPG